MKKERKARPNLTSSGRPGFTQNVILEKIKEKVPGSKFTRIARHHLHVAGLYVGDSWVGLEPGVLRFQWHYNPYRSYTIPIPAFEDPEFSPDVIIDFVVRLVERQQRACIQSEVEFYSISGNKAFHPDSEKIVDYPGPTAVMITHAMTLTMMMNHFMN